MSVPPLAQPGDLAPHINGSTEEGKALGSAGEKGRVGDREVEGGRGHAKGRRGSRRKKKREKREGKLIISWSNQAIHSTLSRMCVRVTISLGGGGGGSCLAFEGMMFHSKIILNIESSFF